MIVKDANRARMRECPPSEARLSIVFPKPDFPTLLKFLTRTYIIIYVTITVMTDSEPLATKLVMNQDKSRRRDIKGHLLGLLQSRSLSH